MLEHQAEVAQGSGEALVHHEGPLTTLEPILDLLSSIFIVTVIVFLLILRIPVSLPLPRPLLLFLIIIITVDCSSILSLEFSHISGVLLPV